MVGGKNENGGIEITVDPKEKLRSALRYAALRVSDLTIPLKQISQEWFASNKFIFQLKGPGKYSDLSSKPFFAFWEPPWSGLKRFYPGGYKEYKGARYGNVYPILKATGRLAESITNPSHENAISFVINKKDLTLGTNVEYANFLDKGTRSMPARPVVLFGNEQVAPQALNRRIAIWEERLLDYCDQVSTAGGGTRGF